MNSVSKFTAGVLILSLIALLLWGWTWNIIKIFDIAGDPLTGMFLLRLAGVIIAPLGAALGFL